MDEGRGRVTRAEPDAHALFDVRGRSIAEKIQIACDARGHDRHDINSPGALEAVTLFSTRSRSSPTRVEAVSFRG
jgi:hypothetical protein